jgi:hypothetical protein
MKAYLTKTVNVTNKPTVFKSQYDPAFKYEIGKKSTALKLGQPITELEVGTHFGICGYRGKSEAVIKYLSENIFTGDNENEALLICEYDGEADPITRSDAQYPMIRVVSATPVKVIRPKILENEIVVPVKVKVRTLGEVTDKIHKQVKETVQAFADGAFDESGNNWIISDVSVK